MIGFAHPSLHGSTGLTRAALRLLEPDPSRRLTAAQALQDPWLERAPELPPAAKSYAAAVEKSRKSETKPFPSAI